MAFTNLPPNLKDMFYSLSDRISKLETGPNQAMYTATSAQGTSSQALTEAAQALAEASAAYALGAQSLQKSANTITNASNQITAINGTGITVYSGASATSGARVVLNSAGLAGFKSNGDTTFAIDASTGAVSTTGAIFTSSTISGGSLNINGNTTIDTNGKLTSVQGVFTGSITAYSGSFAGSITATTGTIGGWTIGTDKLSSGTSEMSSNTGNAIFNKVTGFGEIYGYANLYITTTGYFGGLLETAASATFGSGATYPFKYFSSTGVLQSPGTYQNTVSTRAVYLASSGNMGTVASTIRKKHEIKSFEIDQQALLNLDVKKFKYLPEIDPEQTQQYGFIAEQAEELGLLPLILYDAEGKVDYFAYEKLPIFLLQVIKQQDKRITELENKLLI
jgi:hypothetical protein